MQRARHELVRINPVKIQLKITDTISKSEQTFEKSRIWLGIRVASGVRKFKLFSKGVVGSVHALQSHHLVHGMP